ncbi:MAG: hypothetical protein U0003_00390 [Vampirovibrionales bacterium]
MVALWALPFNAWAQYATPYNPYAVPQQSPPGVSNPYRPYSGPSYAPPQPSSYRPPASPPAYRPSPSPSTPQPATTPPADVKDYADYYAEANRFYQNGQLTEAIAAYQKALPLAQGAVYPLPTTTWPPFTLNAASIF